MFNIAPYCHSQNQNILSYSLAANVENAAYLMVSLRILSPADLLR